MFPVVAALVLLVPCASALMSKITGPSRALAAGAADAGAAIERVQVQGLSRLSSSYEAFLIGELCAGIADRTASFAWKRTGRYGSLTCGSSVQESRLQDTDCVTPIPVLRRAAVSA